MTCMTSAYGSADIVRTCARSGSSSADDGSPSRSSWSCWPAAAWWLGEWQFGRLEDRQARNEVIRTNEAREPAPVDAVLRARRAGRPTREEWRLVQATGTYDPAAR